MRVFQCMGCEIGPCTLTNIDPDAPEPQGACNFQPINLTVWRELVVAE